MVVYRTGRKFDPELMVVIYASRGPKVDDDSWVPPKLAHSIALVLSEKTTATAKTQSPNESTASDLSLAGARCRLSCSTAESTCGYHSANHTFCTHFIPGWLGQSVLCRVDQPTGREDCYFFFNKSENLKLLKSCR